MSYDKADVFLLRHGLGRFCERKKRGLEKKKGEAPFHVAYIIEINSASTALPTYSMVIYVDILIYLNKIPVSLLFTLWGFLWF